MNHITFDLETLGTGPKAPIVQLAAVQFDEKGEVLKSFNRRIHLGEDAKLFEADISTIEWWLSQTSVAQKIVFNSQGRMCLREVLLAFRDWINGIEGTKRFWSHATFDPPVLMNAYNAMMVVSPINYKEFMDIRTIKFLAGTVDVGDRMKFGEPHDAIADCKYQAAYIATMMEKLKQ